MTIHNILNIFNHFMVLLLQEIRVAFDKNSFKKFEVKEVSYDFLS